MLKKRVLSGEIWLIENDDGCKTYPFPALIGHDNDRGWYFIDLSEDEDYKWAVYFVDIDKDPQKQSKVTKFKGYKLVRRICGTLPVIDVPTESRWV